MSVAETPTTMGMCIKQDQESIRYDSILQWLQMENGLVIMDTHTPNLEMLSHLKIAFAYIIV